MFLKVWSGWVAADARTKKNPHYDI